MKTGTLGFIGGGRITRIFLQAFRNKSLEFESILVYEPHKDVAIALKTRFPESEIAGTPSEPSQQDVVFLAVHPPVMVDTLNLIKKDVKKDASIVSLAPKFTVEKLAAILGHQRIARMIPNATSYVNKGYNPVCFHHSFAAEDKDALMGLFKKLGKTFEVEEELLEAYAMVSAMLPTYFWFQWKKLEELAIKMGFGEEDARKVLRKTLDRSLKLYFNSDLTPEEVIDLIPVKPIGEHEAEIEQILESKLLGLYQKIKP